MVASAVASGSSSVYLQRFSRKERLKKQRRIALLFAQGKRRKFPPLQLLYCVYPVPECSHQAAFIVPKRYFRKSVDRQLLRRRLREAHRKHKYLLQPLVRQQIFLLIGYSFTSSQLYSYAQIAAEVQSALKWLSEQLIQHRPIT